MRQVHGWGSLAARYILIGEAPSEREEEQGEPFVGASGWRLKEWWAKAGLRREDFFIDNVCQYRPPHNNIDAFDTEYLKQWMSHLHERVAHLTDPFVLIPTGNYALYALTGKGKVKWHQKDGNALRAGITEWRGSILSYLDQHGRTIKVVPTIHPAATFRQPDYEGVCIRDWIKIAKEGTFKELNLPVRTHDTAQTPEQVETYLGSFTTGSVVAVDIENPREHTIEERLNEDTGRTQKVKVPQPARIVCLAFSHDPHYSLTVPTTRAYWGDDATLEHVWGLIRGALQRDDTDKVFHNGLYDCFHLQWERAIAVRGYRFDTLYLHHALDPSDKHGLAYCASHDSREPYWKSDFKDPDEIAKDFYNSQETFYRYNGKDAAVTRELYEVYATRLSDQGRLQFYLQHYAALLAPLSSLQLHGVRVNDIKRRFRCANLSADCIEIQDRLEALTGLQLYGKSSLSNTKLKTYLYETLKLPAQERQRKARGEKTTTVDELAVRKLMLKYPKVLGEIGPLILTHKRKDKLREFYAEDRVDADGYFRSSYSMNTEAGRLSSYSNPNGTGSNAQNVDREARDMFTPDDGCVLIEVDLSAAEARINYLITYMLTGSKDLYEKSRLRPDEYDQHTENASYIFNVPTDDVTKEQRYLGKVTVHGSWRDMQGARLSDSLMKDGIIRTPSECQQDITAYRQRVTGIEDYFRWCRRQAIEHHYVENSWGRRLNFTHDRFGDEVYRRIYSYYPQSEIADWMNQLGLVPFWWYIQDLAAREGQPVGAINVHAHDALVFSAKPQYAYNLTQFLVTSLEQERTMYGASLFIPCEIKLGRSWKGDVAWKRLPPQAKFEEAVHGLTV